METLLESRLWKSAMIWGVLTAVLGALILVWPGQSIQIASTLFGLVDQKTRSPGRSSL